VVQGSPWVQNPCLNSERAGEKRERERGREKKERKKEGRKEKKEKEVDSLTN
jgi:hypothetical protein